jgi:hypothetical protein
MKPALFFTIAIVGLLLKRDCCIEFLCVIFDFCLTVIVFRANVVFIAALFIFVFN